MRARHDVVVTGVGAVTPLGTTWPETWDGLVSGRSNVRAWPFFDASTYPAQVCGVVPEGGDVVDDLRPNELTRLGRPARMGIRAAFEAIADAGLSTGGELDAGVIFGHSVGRPELGYLEGLEQAISTGDGRRVALAPSTALAQEPNVALNLIARHIGATGPIVGISTACAAAGHAIGEAFRAIQDGDVDTVVTGGFDSLTSWIDLAGFGLLGALSASHNEEPDKASRPFDAERDGFVIGEGAAALVLESAERAAARGARVLGRINGYGASLNAWRVTDSPPDGSGAFESMAAALADAHWSADSLDAIVAHGTSTPSNDRAETVAIRRVTGTHADNLVVMAPKSSMGHLTAASAGVGVLTALATTRHHVVPPTLNLTTPDPECDLNHVPGTAARRRIDRVLVNAFAFGGTNTCLAVSGAGCEGEPA